MNTAALKNPCTYKYNKQYSVKPVEEITIKKPQWLMVEYASVFFVSDWCIDIRPPRKAVVAPTTETIKKEYLLNSKRGANLTNKKTPAETKVAEWINAEAGTGASMESGNQMCAPNCADFINAHTKKKKLIKSITETLNKKKLKKIGVAKNIWFKKTFISKVKKFEKTSIIANNKKASLTLLKEYALKAALNVLILATQKLIKKKDVNPISSQPKNKPIKLPEVTKNIILNMNKFKRTKRRSTFGSYLKYENEYK